MQPKEIVVYLPEILKSVFEEAEIDWEHAEEIRIRTGKPVLLYMNNQEFYLTEKGGLVSDRCRNGNEKLCVVQEGWIREILNRMSGYSMYAYEEELRQGYFTLEGGHRVGIAGQAVYDGTRIKTLKHLGFLNIRIAHEKKNCGRVLSGRLVQQGRLQHTLIISPPGCGKTTLLRDLIRIISNGFYYEEGGKRKFFCGITVGLVDERSEIAACVNGVPTMDVGIRTDVMDGCPKHAGIFLLLRSMAPKVIAVDEIGNEKDFEAIHQAVNSGCTILATAHGSGWKDLRKKEIFASFLREQIFEQYIVLSGKKGKGTIEEIRNGKNLQEEMMI